MESRVGVLTLRARAAAPRMEAVRRPAEDFVTRVLRRSAELLERRAPGRVLLVRELDLKLRLREGGLGNDAEVGAVAARIADALEEAASGGEAPGGDPEVAVFEDEAEWRAAHLEAWAGGRSAGDWRFGALEAEGEPLRMLIDGDLEGLAFEVLARVFRRGSLLAALRALPGDAVRVLSKSGSARRAEAGASGRSVPLPPSLEAFAGAWPADLSAAHARVAAAVAAGAACGRLASGADVADVARAVFTRIVNPAAEKSRGGAADAGEAEDAGPRGRSASPNAASVSAFSTELGGLFYLLPLALELGIGEALWHACLPEGEVLAAAAAALAAGVGAETDPAPALFGGARPGAPCPDVLPAQQEEIAASLLESLLDALPRRGLASFPEPVLSLRSQPSGRLLVASAESSAFVLFAQPAADPAGTRSAVERFVRLWPASAPAPRGSPALAGLDRRSRIRPSRDRDPVEPFVPEAGSPAECALLAQIAGSLGHLFAARLGMETPWRPADLAARLRLPARVVVTDGALEVLIPMDGIDLDVRRAGLDADPGFVPWLGRTVRFEFVEREDAG